MKDYIVLSGQDADIEGSYFAWNIPPDYFIHWEHNDDVYVRLSSCRFTGDSNKAGSSLTLAQAVIEVDMISAQNQKTTNEMVVLSIAPVTFQGDANGGIVFSNNVVPNPQYKTNRFQKIRLRISYQGAYLDMSYYTQMFDAMFEIEYVKPQPKN